IREIIPEVPQWLCDLIARLHAKDPAQRFQSAAEVAALLEQHLAHLQHPSLVSRPQTGNAPRPRPPRPVAILAAAGVALVVLGAGLSYFLWPPAGPTPATTGRSGPDSGGQAQLPATAPSERPSTEVRSHVLQGRAVVRDALIDFGDPERC